MITIDELFSSGQIIDLILAFVVIEAALLAFFRNWHGISLPGLLGNLLSGACLLLALRIALVGGSWQWIALALVGALLAHILDFNSRWRGEKSQASQ